jgi:hypothetical protein
MRTQSPHKGPTSQLCCKLHWRTLIQFQHMNFGELIQTITPPKHPNPCRRSLLFPFSWSYFCLTWELLKVMVSLWFIHASPFTFSKLMIGMQREDKLRRRCTYQRIHKRVLIYISNNLQNMDRGQGGRNLIWVRLNLLAFVYSRNSEFNILSWAAGSDFSCVFN